MAAPLDLLVDIMERYLLSIGRITQKYSEQFGRSDASYGDALLALTDMGVCLPELLDFMKNVDPVEFPKKMPAFPAPKSCKLIYEEEACDSDAPGSGRSPQHSTSAGESLSSGMLAVNRRSLTASSPDQPWQPRPLQELSNSEFRARCRQLLDSDGTDIEEKLSRAPDPRPPLQMAQIMRQRRPALSIPPISISGVTTSVLVLNPGLGGSGAEAVRHVADGDLPEPAPAKVKKDRSSLSSSALAVPPVAASKGSAAKRSKTGGSKATAAVASSKSSSDSKRRERAAAAKRRKRDQGYTALAEALTATPLQSSSATSVAASAQPATANWQSSGGPSLASSVAVSAPSRSASKHAALSAAYEQPVAAAASSGGSSRPVSPAVGRSRGPRGATTAAPVASSSTAAYMRHLDDTFDAVIRGAGTSSSGDDDRNGDRGGGEEEEEDEEEEEVDVDVEALNQSHEQLASPPPHLLPLSGTSFAPVPPPPRVRSTIDDVIDSVARGDVDIEFDLDGSDQAKGDEDSGIRKVPSEERTKKRKKKSKAARSKPQPRPSPTNVDDVVSGEPTEEVTEEVECHSDVTSVAAGCSEPLLPEFASSPVAMLDSHERLEVEIVHHESTMDEPSVNIVDDELEVVHEVEVGHDAVSVGPPPLQAVPGASVAGGRRSSHEDVSFASGEGSAATLPISFDDAQQEAPLSDEGVADRKKEKHKKEKKEKKKKKNKEKHRERRHGDDGDDAASHSSSVKAHGHKEHRKGEKEHRHKHHHHHRHHHSDGGGSGSRDDERKQEHSSSEHRHKVKDKAAVFSAGDAEGKRKPALAAEVASATASVPKLLFKIAGKTISTVPQTDADGGGDGGGGAGATPVTNFPSDKQTTQASSTAPAAAPRGKATEIYTETEFTGTREVVDIVPEAADSKVWICPGCHQPDDGSPMIGCDKCEEWYHWTCVGVVQAPPEDATWYCPRCLTKKPPKKKAKH